MSLVKLCLVTLFIVCVAAKPESYAVVAPLGDAFEYVDALFEQFLALKNSTLVDANNRLNVLGNKILLLEDQTSSIVNAELNSTIQAFLQQISNLETTANQYGVSISDCVGDSREQINALPSEASTAVLQCIVSPKNNLTIQISDVSNNITATFNQWVDIFQTELTQCKAEAESLQAACASTLGTEIGQVKTSFPNTVNQKVTNVESQFPDLEKEYVKCSTNQVAAVNNRASLIVADVVGCANEIFFTASTTTSTAAPAPVTTLAPSA